ncbi:MAG: Stress responsive alpha-beta barrel domain protein [Streptosporangiaceae bacterium]|jgi:hypothetical protein|nr:Stress responsive alpha-beta barrel domain protein [Streptosporangiaceae bacterium]
MSGLRHVVLFTWTPEATQEQKDTLQRRLAGLPGLVPEIKAYSYGSDAGINEGGYDFAIIADFADLESYLVYRDHPDHRALIEECITPIRDQRAAIQYELA